MKLLTSGACLLVLSPHFLSGAIVWSGLPTNAGPGSYAPGLQTFTLDAVSHADSVYTLTASDLSRMDLDFRGLRVNGGGLETLNAGLDMITTGVPQQGRIEIETTRAYSAGDILEFTFAYETPLTSATDADIWWPGYAGGNQNVSHQGGDAAYRIAMLFDNDDFADPNPANAVGTIAAVSATLSGFNVGAGVTGEFTDDFNSTDLVANTGSVLNFSPAQFYDGRFTGDGAFSATAIDMDSTGGAPDNGVSYWSASEVTWKLTLGEDLPIYSQVSFTFDGTPIPEPSRGALFGLAASCFLLRRKR